jgi:hypothetical protein
VETQPPCRVLWNCVASELGAKDSTPGTPQRALHLATRGTHGDGMSHRLLPVAAHRRPGEEGMACFPHPVQQGRPGLIVLSSKGVGRGLVRPTDVPPVGGDPPHQPKAGASLQGCWSPLCAGGIEAGMLVLLGYTPLVNPVFSAPLR